MPDSQGDFVTKLKQSFQTPVPATPVLMEDNVLYKETTLYVSVLLPGWDGLAKKLQSILAPAPLTHVLPVRRASITESMI